MTSRQRHECMSHIKAKNTRPEMLVRSHLHKAGLRFRIHVAKLPGCPDIVLPKYRTVIFVNGCFWHGHKGCRLYTVPDTNRQFWTDKVARNKERDLRVVALLEALSWNVITIWECELKKAAIGQTMQRVEAQIAENQARWEEYRQRRRTDREFAIAETRRKRALQDQVTKTLQEQYDIPESIVRLSLKDFEE